jgi:hypothetical protein
MSTFDEFEEQTDFSFLSLEFESPVAKQATVDVTPKKGRSVKIGDTSISISFTFKHTDATKAKISATTKGKVLSDDRRAQISAATKGRFLSGWTWNHTPESRAKMSAARKGKVLSDEHRANVSKALKGKKHSAEHTAKRVASRAERFRERTANGMVRSNSKSIMTPAGIFSSRGTAANFFNVRCPTIGLWMKECPEQFYYITKD